MGRVLSKSKLVAFRQCPKRLWLEVHRPELREDSSKAQAKFNVGFQVCDIARPQDDPVTTTEHKAEIERQLVAYCGLDTLALVRLWSAFSGSKVAVR